MNEKLKVSVIIPFYNSQAFIERCIHSIGSQTLSEDEFEIIAVNDGSNDNSADIVRRLQKKYKNLYLFHQSNGRQGKARNTGMRVAKGKYLLFVDSDDCIVCRNALDVLISTAEKYELDVLQSSSWQVISKEDNPSGVIEREHISVQLFSRDDFLTGKENCSCSVCCSLYRREQLIQKQLFFRENCFFEDTDWSLLAVYHYGYDARIALVDFPYYGYRENQSSTTRTYSLKLMEDNIMAVSYLLDQVERLPMSDPLRDAFMERCKGNVLRYLYDSRNYKLHDSLCAFQFLDNNFSWNKLICSCTRREACLQYILRHVLLRALCVFIVRFLCIAKRQLLK